jgi:methylated-DNA-[protein]-cysteine S-methyltransferase
MTMTSTTYTDSPVGRLELRAEGGQLTGIYFEQHAGRAAAATDEHVEPEDAAVLAEARGQLQAYFAGTRQGFELSLGPRGTPFQRAVWQALAALPFGTTVSYAELARRIGRPGAARAVGLANARNPIAIVVPCHRVIGENGTLTGYAGGLATKRWLLDHERAGSPQEQFAFGRQKNNLP